MSTWFADATLWDWAIGLVILVSVLLGLWRGFIRTAFGLAAWVLAFLFTGLVSSVVRPWVEGVNMPPVVLEILVFLVLFVLCKWVGFLVSRAMRAIGLGGLDRFFGAVLGGARAAVIITMMAMTASVLTQRGIFDLSWHTAHARPMLDAMSAAGFQFVAQSQPGH